MKSIEVDRTKRLSAEPGTGHNRFHPDIVPLVEVDEGEEVVLETRDVHRLVETYGGRKARWVKKSSPRFEIGLFQYEFHWYEYPGIGRVEVKRKQMS